MNNKIKILFLLIISCVFIFTNVSKVEAGSKWECYFQNSNEYSLSAKGWFSNYINGLEGYHGMELQAFNGGVISSNSEDIRNMYHDRKLKGIVAPGYYKSGRTIPDNDCPAAIVVVNHKYNFYAFKSASEAAEFANQVNNNTKYTAVYATNVPESSYNKFIEKASEQGMTIPEQEARKMTSERDLDENVDCALFSAETIQLVNKYMNWIRIIVPIMIIALGTVDVFEAVTSSKEDEMKKSMQRFTKRLIIGVLIFLTPFLVNLLLNILNSAWGSNYSTCGVK